MENIKVTNYTKKEFDVSVIIVNWNSGKYLEETINSLIDKTQDVSYEIIIVDNNSLPDDESMKFIDNQLQKYNNVTIIKSENNNGFGKGNNIGIKYSKGRNILFMNPDIILENNVVQILSKYLDEKSEVGMIGPKLFHSDGKFVYQCKRGEPDPFSVFLCLSKIKFLRNHPKYYSFSQENTSPDEMCEVAGLSGCLMMVKKELIDDIGAFDEQFFLYQEETDWCYRAYKSGWKLIYNPEAVIVHHHGVCTNKNKFKNNIIFAQSMMKFFKKHHWENYNIFQKGLWTTLIWGNFVLKCIKTKF